jgi:hypothetical protein
MEHDGDRMLSAFMKQILGYYVWHYLYIFVLFQIKS